MLRWAPILLVGLWNTIGVLGIRAELKGNLCDIPFVERETWVKKATEALRYRLTFPLPLFLIVTQHHHGYSIGRKPNIPSILSPTYVRP